MAEGVCTPAELQSSFRVIVGESGRGARRGVTRRFFILLRRTERTGEREMSVIHPDFVRMV